MKKTSLRAKSPSRPGPANPNPSGLAAEPTAGSSRLVFFPSWAAGREGYAARIREVFHRYVLSQGLVHTHQREDILNHLLTAERHLTQDEIYASLRSKGIGKVTVFRTLKLLEESHLVERVTGSNNVTRYEIKMDRPHHDHLVCLSCGDIIEVQWPEVERFQEKVCRELGFQPLYHRHEVFGRCQKCRKGPNPPIPSTTIIPAETFGVSSE